MYFLCKAHKEAQKSQGIPFLCFLCLFVANNSFVDVNCSSPLHEDRNMAKKNDSFNPSRRKFIKGAALTVGTTGLAGAGQEVNAAPQARVQWDRTADVVVIGAGASGLPAAIMARDRSATVILIDANHDI